MSESDEDQDSKTEEASQKKLEDAIEKGQVAYSKEVTNFLMLLFLSIVVIFLLPYCAQKIASSLRFFISDAANVRLDCGIIEILLGNILLKSLIYISPILVTVISVALLSSYIQHGEFIFAIDQVMPQLSRISIASGLKRLFSMRSLVEMLKGIVKISIIGIFIYLLAIADIKYLRLYPNFTVEGILHELHSTLSNIMIWVAILMSLIAATDFFYQRFEYLNNLKMTKQEKKEEYKQLEGHPEVKRKIRSLRREKSQYRVKQAVAKSTVVITNPEHYAVALYYEPGATGAPVLLIKGADLIAQTIKRFAAEYEVPIVEDPPLARGIYKKVKPNKEIPVEYYEAVAKIISYVMSLNANKSFSQR